MFSSLVVLGACLVGCNGSEANNAAATNGAMPAVNTPDANTSGGTSATTGNVGGSTGGTGGVAPMAAGAGGMTPVSGSDSVTGAGGGGVGQAAKQMAKDKTANMGSGSLNQGEKDDSGQ